MTFKSVFVIISQGRRMYDKIEKLCQGFGVTLYPIPATVVKQKKLEKYLRFEIIEMNTVYRGNIKQCLRILRRAAKNINMWQNQIILTKAIYHTMNMLSTDVSTKFLLAEGWTPVSEIQNVRSLLKMGTKMSGVSTPAILLTIDTNQPPPTYNRSNKFVNGFQALTDAYGIACYREINPAPFLTVTFPFLFAVMFGDIGHGLILLLIGLWAVVKETPLIVVMEQSTNEIVRLMFAGRYIILMMGIFSVYTGVLYNDCFASSFNWFGPSSWTNVYNASTIMSNKVLQFDPSQAYSGTPKWVGIDPIWQVAPANKIIFLNAFKMKISVIFGVVHMLFGLTLAGFNHRFFGNRFLLFAEFIPRIIFLVFLFGYLALMMFLKWNWYSPKATGRFSPGCAPSILITFINMMLMKKPQEEEGDCSPYMFAYQYQLQCCLVIVALLTIPCMLLLKPIYLLRKGSDHDKTELFIEQAISTIEFVLGSISHTASYLRLWALSLAHAQLSDVLWNMVLKHGLMGANLVGGIALSVSFGIWATLTVAILVMMEGLSAFLHTLRLHWLVFCNHFIIIFVFKSKIN